MANVPPKAVLNAEERELIRRWLTEFNRAWAPGRLAACIAELPECEGRVRTAAIAELVKLDLARHWQSGKPVELESYLERYPELGDRNTVSLSLVRAEYEARIKSATPAPLQEMAERFPRQASQLDKASKRPTPPPSMTAQHSTHPAPVPERFGRYQVVRRLGEGGMGTVYLARDEQLGRDVALKVPHFGPGTSPAVRQRFEREGRAAAALRHPNICSIFDIGEVDGVPYLTMSYIRGRPLTEYVERTGGIPAHQAAALVRKMALALKEAHRAGVIHRDLKPSNIMIDERKEPILMDFGLARFEGADEARLTRHGAILGTPSYMSPEQVAGDVNAMGPACDIYSLGVILYELLCGRPPFTGPATLVLGLVLTQTAPPPTDFRPGLDPAIVVICLRAVASKPADRFASMDEFAAALTDYLKNSDRIAPPIMPPVAHAPGSPPARLPPVAYAPGSPSIPTLELSPEPRSGGIPWRFVTPAISGVVILIALVVWLATRGNGDKDEGKKTPPPPSRAGLRLEAIPDVTLTPGEKTEIPIIVTREQCEGPVLLAFSGLPKAILVGANSSIPGDRTSLRLEVFAEPTATPGSGPVEVTASLGSHSVKERFSLTVKEKATTNVTPPSITVQGALERTLMAGKSTTWEVQVGRQGFSGAIDVTLLDLPAGVLCKPVTVTAGRSRATLDISATANVKPGDYAVRFLASGGTVRGEMKGVLRVQSAAELHLQPVAAVKLEAGEQIRVRLTVTRVNCDGPVTVTVQGLPDRVSVRGRVTIPAGVNETEMTLAAMRTAPAADKTLQLKAHLGDLSSETTLALSVQNPAAATKLDALPDPGNLRDYRKQTGKSFIFDVTGRVTGSVYGTLTYTDDSSLATAAVHAGVLKNGERGLVRVTILPGQQAYQSSRRNGVVSSAWDSYYGSFKVEFAGKAPAKDPELGNLPPGVLEDPGTLAGYQGQIGKVLLFRVTGRNTGTVYGTGFYTDDSELATAAVHAGVLANGKTGTVKVTILRGARLYRGSTRYGVTSSDWLESWDGSYSVERYP